MTTVRKWGVQYTKSGNWKTEGGAPKVFSGIECAALHDSPESAVLAIGPWGPCIVREVLVTQEAGGWELGEPTHVVRSTPHACVVCSGDYFLGLDDRLTGDRERAVIFPDSRAAFAAALRLNDSATGVYAIRRTEPREVRRAGRTLDEILASVPVEVPNDA